MPKPNKYRSAAHNEAMKLERAARENGIEISVTSGSGIGSWLSALQQRLDSGESELLGIHVEIDK